MRFLFCKPKYIGDTLLLSGTLAAVRRALPDAELWVAVREGTEGILSGCDAIDGFLFFDAKKNLRADLALALKARAMRFDIVFELGDNGRGRRLALLSGGRKKYANGHPVHMGSGFWRNAIGRHVRENYNTPGIPRALWDYRTVAAALPLPDAEEVRPVFARSRADFAAAKTLVGGRPALVVHPVASVAENRWSADRWAAFIGDVTPEYDVVLSSGPAAGEIAYVEAILSGVTDKSAMRFTGGRLDWPAMAGLLYSSVAYIGADTAAMHLASACGTPILGVFGRNAEEHVRQWRPAGERVRIVTFAPGENGIADIPASRVTAAFREIFPA